MPQGARLEQRVGINNHFTYEVKDDDIYITHKKRGESFQWHFPIAGLDDNTMEFWTRQQRGLTAGCVLTAIGLGVFALVMWMEIPDAIRGLGAVWEVVVLGGIVSSVFLVPGIIVLFFAWRRVDRAIRVFDRYSGNPLFGITADKPSRDAVAAFMEPLLLEARRLSKEYDEHALAAAERFNAAAEIRKFHELRGSGIINAEEYEEKKSGILRQMIRG